MIHSTTSQSIIAIKNWYSFTWLFPLPHEQWRTQVLPPLFLYCDPGSTHCAMNMDCWLVHVFSHVLITTSMPILIMLPWNIWINGIHCHLVWQPSFKDWVTTISRESMCLHLKMETLITKTISPASGNWRARQERKGQVKSFTCTRGRSQMSSAVSCNISRWEDDMLTRWCTMV